MVLKRIRKNKSLVRALLMFACVYFLVSHIWQFNLLMEYEDVPMYVNVYNPAENLEDYSQLKGLNLTFNNSFNLGNTNLLLNDSNYNSLDNVYTVQQTKSTQRSVTLLNIMFDLFLISLLWHAKVEDEED